MDIIQNPAFQIGLARCEPLKFCSRIKKRGLAVAPKPRPDKNLDTDEALDKSVIADLSKAQIDRMSRSELVRVVRVSGLPLLEGGEQGVEGQTSDLQTLRQLAYLARMHCRNQRF